MFAVAIGKIIHALPLPRRHSRRKVAMQRIKLSFWGLLALSSVLWLAADPSILQWTGYFAFRAAMVQHSGVIAVGCMSVAMILALRPRWPEPWFGGLDKMYRLHKWLGIGALAFADVHWLWTQGTKWAVGWGWLDRPRRGPRAAPGAASGATPDNPVAQTFIDLRGIAEAVGEWAFYAILLLIVLALIKSFPYRLFLRTHRLLPIAYLALVFHTVILTKFAYWTAPIGWVLGALLASGTWAAVLSLLGRVGAGRRVPGTIRALHTYPDLRVLEAEIDVPQGWPGHKAGQFAFAVSDAAEGAHPYTIASAWNEAEHRIVFIIKELGDHTQRLPSTLQVGQAVTVEGPYGCFTFDDQCPHQIWVGGGIGVTPFIARMKYLAIRPERHPQAIHFFHTTRDYDEVAIAKLTADAAAAGVCLHLLIDGRDGQLTGERIRAAVPGWRDASVWFCGPTGFGQALRQDFAAQGMPVEQRFHQELFDMR
ncbi:ferredoxin reductase family protein [Azospirillum palustre]|nr:ferric reductase-like transmembrane domain-containing protein [Azospirillum palustre]